ncbi:flagellar brake domain-containing protein [Bacillus sp. EB600]|uniref:flagellar brake protein n=1 Tax=Bacillus sp. EB600 TaxID=2806345 RepID=UPI0028118DAF|nr:flagellar brake domain-containing protein [Bacillus sp. EB600]
MFDLVQIGDVLTLELKSSEDEEKFRCRLVDIRDNEFYIDYPISLTTNRAAFLLDGTQLKVTFVGNDGSSIYLFESEINGRIKKNIPMLILTYPGNNHLIKIQRRQYVRVETAVDIAIQPLEFEFAPITTITDDLSAGGAAVLIPKEVTIKTGMRIVAWLVLIMQNGDYHYMKLQSRIVRIISFSDTRNKVSIQFLDVSNQERQLLLRFSFERQLEAKKKGLPT